MLLYQLNSCIKFNSYKINRLERYDSAQNYRILKVWSAFVPTQTQNSEPPPYTKASSKNMPIGIKLVGMHMIFHSIYRTSFV
jgi:hypothetical protein